MPAIGRSTALAACLCLTLPQVAGVAAPSDQEQIAELLLTLSAALEEGNAPRFLAQVDRDRCPEYAALENNVVALLAQNAVGSSIGVIEQTRHGETYDLKLDWLLHLRPAGGDGPAERRRQDVRCRIERRGKRWKVTALEPVAFFTAIRK